MIEKQDPLYEKPYKTGEIIKEGKGGNLLLVTEGVVAVAAKPEDPEWVPLPLLVPKGRWIGAEKVFLSLSGEAETVIKAVTPTTVGVLPVPVFETLDQDTQDEIRKKLVVDTVTAYIEVQKTTSLAFTATPEVRLLATLKTLAEYAGEPHKLGTSVEVPAAFLSELSGLRKVATWRATTALINQGKITKTGKSQYTVLK